MSMDCKLAKILLTKFGYLEKRVTYLEGKSRGQQIIIEKLQKKLKLNMTTRNRGQSQSSEEEFEEEPVDVKPNLIEVTESILQNEQLNIVKNDKKLSQKIVVQMGVRCTGNIQGFSNSSSDQFVERKNKSKISQGKTKSTRQNVKTEDKSLKPKRKVKKSQICAFCLKSFSCFSLLSMHMRVHTGERPFKCEVCSKEFTQISSLNLHSRIHTFEKAFSCLVCSKAFVQLANLHCHMGVHTGEKPYSCSVCSRTFAQSSYLKLHIMRKHSSTYSCSICPKKFGRESLLKIHERNHNGEKPHKCPKCKKKFNYKSSLVYHRKKNINCQ